MVLNIFTGKCLCRGQFRAGNRAKNEQPLGGIPLEGLIVTTVSERGLFRVLLFLFFSFFGSTNKRRLKPYSYTKYMRTLGCRVRLRFGSCQALFFLHVHRAVRGRGGWALCC